MVLMGYRAVFDEKGGFGGGSHRHRHKNKFNCLRTASKV